MTPRFQQLTEKKVVGMRLTMSFAQYRISELWKAFIPRRAEIKNNLTSDLISLVVYPPAHFTAFNPTNEFERWAAVEVADFDSVPNEMETYTIPGGLYAIFDYRGSSKDPAVYSHILGSWLPDSDYLLDYRPHFEVLGKNYRNDDPASEEAIWIPVIPKNARG